MNRVKSVNNVFLATVLVSIIGAFINDFVSRFTNNYFILLLLSQIVLIIPSIAYFSIFKVNIPKAIRFNKMKVSNIILAVIFAYLITPVMNFINAISMLFVHNDISDVANNIVENNGFWLTLFMMALVPCILEESVYRGLFYNEYRKISPLKGIFLSGFLFGIMHQNFNQFSYAFAMGILFALLIEATDSILSTMIVHFIINGTSVLILSLYPKVFKLIEAVYGTDNFNAQEWINTVNGGGIQDQLTFSFIVQNYGLAAVIGSILAFIVYRTIAKNSGRWEFVKSIFTRKTVPQVSIDTSSQIPLNIASQGSVDGMNVIAGEKQHLLTITLIIGILICVGLMLVSEFYFGKLPDQPMEELTSTAFMYLI